MHYDDFLERIGGCGRYQLLLFFLLGMTAFKSGIDLLALVLAVFTPDVRCIFPWNSTFSNNSEAHCTSPINPNVSCTEWAYDRSLMARTMVTEFDLVCDRKYLPSLFEILVLVGIGVGRVLSLLSDRFGRKKAIFLVAAHDLVLTPIQAFVPGLVPQFVIRSLRGLGDTVKVLGLYFIMEIVATRHRLKLGCNYWIFYCLGYASTGLIGKLLRDWRFVQAAAMVVTPFYLLLFVAMVESPRWLLVKGRKTEAVQVLRRIAWWNGRRDISDEEFESIRVEEETATGRLADVFSTRQMTLKTLASAVIIVTFSFTYIGLTLDARFANDDIFLNMAFLGLIEIAASPLAWIIGDRMGRRLPTMLLLFASAAIIMGVPQMPKGDLTWLRTLVAVWGKLVLTTGYCITCVYVGELQPTCVRNVTTMPNMALFAFGSILATVVLNLPNYALGIAFWVPSLIFGVLCLVGVMAIFPLPETVGLPLTQTIAEADLLVRGQEHRFKQRLERFRAGLEEEETDSEIEQPLL